MKIVEMFEKIFSQKDIGITAFRFGCAATNDRFAVSLRYPNSENSTIKNFNDFREAYKSSVTAAELSGPTTLAPLLKKALEAQSA